MASHGHEDADDARRRYQAPYSKHHPIPTIAKYREEKAARQAEASLDNGDDGADLQQSRTDRAKESWRNYWSGEHGEHGEQDQAEKRQQQEPGTQQGNGIDVDGDGDVDQDDHDQAEAVKDTSEVNPALTSKQRRKGNGKRQERADREVTDPVTHLPVRIYDFTEDSLKDIDPNPPPFGSTSKTATGLSNKNKSERELRDEAEQLQEGHESMNALFPPPNFDAIRQDLLSINRTGFTVGLSATAAVLLLAVGIERLLRPELARLIGSKDESNWALGIGLWAGLTLLSAGAVWYVIAGVRAWAANRINDTWEDQVWEANLRSSEREAKAHETESVNWLNQLLASVWPLVNPDLFTSLADTLEDVMQASIPKIIQMVSVEDVGQGSESLRILGIRWLPSGAAGRSVGSGGDLQSADESKKQNDRAVAGEGQIDGSAQDKDDKETPDEEKRDQNKSEDGTEKTEIAEGMEAEEGNFINLEVAFAYRARASKSFQDRTKDMHLYLAFYLAGNLKIPVWVDVRGVIGTARLRLQLTPDPPFFALCTLTFLGQPKVDIGCVPLVKRGLNIMDLPLLSNFVQGSVDAAMAEYVAPKSLTLDLKDMLAGDDFKKDTNARGVLIVYIRRGYDFKEGDTAIPMISDGKSDPYVTLGWAKFGKPLFSTRVMISEMEPCWHERAVLLVTPEELNVDERLRLQLWDSDRFTADDDLGRIEVDLKAIMRDEKTNGRMHDRKDGFRALKAGENMPGKLEWSVGYFSKARLQSCQFEQQTYDSDIRSMKDLENKVDQSVQRKLREAHIKKGRHSRDAQELDQQKAQEMKETENAIIISAPPPQDYPSGIFSIQIHQITGLELEKIQGNEDQDSHADEEDEQGDRLPSAYCNIILNHKKVFKTRTKPKNGKPFYNAGTERFVPNWQEAEVYVSVRDARVGEPDPLLGIVHLPLAEVFKERAQIDGYYPLVGGIGYGRVRLSMVWRSVQLQAPREKLGFEFGTIEVKPTVERPELPSDLQSMNMKFHTSLSHGKLYAHHNDRMWKSRRGKSLYLPVQKRYSSNLAIRFKHHGMFKDTTAAFAILWLRDIPDDEEQELQLPVWKGNYERARQSSIDEPGEKIGTITVKLVFWSGLGPAHAKFASKDPNLANVMEVLDVARDNYESKKNEEKAGVVKHEEDKDTDSSSESDDDDDDSDDSSDEEDENKERRHTTTTTNAKQGDNKTDGDDQTTNTPSTTSGLLDKARDYKKHAKQQHRRNRGVMQYKIPRTAQWAANKTEQVGNRFSGIFKRHTREPGLETEV